MANELLFRSAVTAYPKKEILVAQLQHELFLTLLLGCLVADHPELLTIRRERKLYCCMI